MKILGSIFGTHAPMQKSVIQEVILQQYGVDVFELKSELSMHRRHCHTDLN
jgi:hypothetical protein